MKARGGVGVGAPTIILIAVVLCMTVFGTLSLQSARQESELTKRSIEAGASWYAADAEAQRILALTDEALLLGKPLPEGVAGEAGGLLTYAVPVDDARALQVTVDSASGRCTVTEWTAVPVGDWPGGSEYLDLH